MRTSKVVGFVFLLALFCGRANAVSWMIDCCQNESDSSLQSRIFAENVSLTETVRQLSEEIYETVNQGETSPEILNDRILNIVTGELKEDIRELGRVFPSDMQDLLKFLRGFQTVSRRILAESLEPGCYGMDTTISYYTITFAALRKYRPRFALQLHNLTSDLFDPLYDLVDVCLEEDFDPQFILSVVRDVSTGHIQR